MKPSKDSETRGIKAILIFEIIGRPPEKLKEALEDIINQIDKEKGVEVKSKEIKEPTTMKDQKDLFTTFAEVEVEVEEIQYLALLMFKYMPAHIEIISPELIALTNNGWGDILSELTRRLHAYDEVARVLTFQNKQMQEKLDSMTKSQVSSSENVEQEELMPKKQDEKKSKKK